MTAPCLCRAISTARRIGSFAGGSHLHGMRQLGLATRSQSTARPKTADVDVFHEWRPFTDSTYPTESSPSHLKTPNEVFPIGDLKTSRPVPIRYTSVRDDNPDSDPAIQLVKSKLGRLLALQVNIDGVMHDFDPIFLRDSCRCELCRDADTGQKKFDTCDIPSTIRVRGISQDRDGSQTMTWQDDVKGYPITHTTTVGMEALRRLANPAERTEPDWFLPWNAKSFERNGFKIFDYHDFMNDTKTTLDVLRRLQHYGLVFLGAVPKNERSVSHIGERIGPLRDTFYGRTWDVRDKPSAENIAYTSQHIGLHMDLLYMKNPPGFQLLHCLEASESGGASMFADAYKAADIIEHVSPQAFNALATFPVAYKYENGGHSYRDEKPVFEVSPQVHPTSPLSLSRRLTAVNWSPLFQGSLRHTIGVDDEKQDLRNWFRAAKIFSILISSESSTFWHKMAPGQCVIFNNRRVLHGRTAFEGPSSDTAAPQQPRWLKGTYVDTDVFYSACSRFAHQAKREFVDEHRGKPVYGPEETILNELQRLEQEAALDTEEGRIFGKGVEKGSSSDMLARMFNI